MGEKNERKLILVPKVTRTKISFNFLQIWCLFFIRPGLAADSSPAPDDPELLVTIVSDCFFQVMDSLRNLCRDCTVYLFFLFNK